MPRTIQVDGTACMGEAVMGGVKRSMEAAARANRALRPHEKLLCAVLK